MQQAEQIDTPAGAAASSGKSNGFSGSRRGLIGLALAAPIAAAMPGCGAPMPAATKAAMPRERTESEIRAAVLNRLPPRPVDRGDPDRLRREQLGWAAAAMEAMALELAL